VLTLETEKSFPIDITNRQKWNINMHCMAWHLKDKYERGPVSYDGQILNDFAGGNI
jgi:hypothetical protein